MQGDCVVRLKRDKQIENDVESIRILRTEKLLPQVPLLQVVV